MTMTRSGHARWHAIICEMSLQFSATNVQPVVNDFVIKTYPYTMN